MSFFSILYWILIKPIELIFESIFSLAMLYMHSPGKTIIVLSLFVNFLVLPLYRMTDAMQEEERRVQDRMSKVVEHIKKCFSGDERMMMLQTYYRQNDYKPFYSLRSAVSLLLQIPFFIAAYHFLSNLSLLNGASYGYLKDLGKPDGMLNIGGTAVNVLPILMTLINIVAGVIYTYKRPAKDRLQIYGLALAFLVLLYNSPSGLVFYWTLNNVFSLVKNIFSKLKHSRIILAALSSAAGIHCLIKGIPNVLGLSKMFRGKLGISLLIAGIALQMPAVLLAVSRKKPASEREPVEIKTDRRFFTVGSLFLSVLTGLLIPSALLGSAPQDFVNIHSYYNPLWYVVCAVCISFGLFTVWLGIFYSIANDKIKRISEYALFAVSGIAVIDYMLFGKDLGLLSPDLIYEEGLSFSAWEQIINIAVISGAAALLIFILHKWRKTAFQIFVISLIAIIGMSAVNIISIDKSLSLINYQASDKGSASFTLSKKGRNVVVIMLDRAMGEYVPFIMKDNPGLIEKYSGFTYFSNVLSFGPCTNIGTGPLYGGYEYTPIEINERSDEKLVDKQNEALKVLPVLFDENGYNVTVCDPPYANYQQIPDLSIYDDYPDINAYITIGAFRTDLQNDRKENNQRNFFCYGLMKITPPSLQSLVYRSGIYNNPSVACVQITYSKYTASGQNGGFLNNYSVLENFINMTKLDNDETGSFLILANKSTHEPTMLSEPDYVPADQVDNTLFEEEHGHDLTVDGSTLKMDTNGQIMHYQINVASLKKLGEWFDYLRENDVYDNTRIILVADHGVALSQLEELVMYPDNASHFDAARYFPLLMVKDFDSEEYTVSDEFMTNADVPYLAVNGIIEDPVNPFTGKTIDTSEKTAHDQFIYSQYGTQLDNRNSGTYRASGWMTVHDSIWECDNWTIIKGAAVLDRDDVAMYSTK